MAYDSVILHYTTKYNLSNTVLVQNCSFYRLFAHNNYGLKLVFKNFQSDKESKVQLDNVHFKNLISLGIGAIMNAEYSEPIDIELNNVLIEDLKAMTESLLVHMDTNDIIFMKQSKKTQLKMNNVTLDNRNMS